jgi:hypothetical protein
MYVDVKYGQNQTAVVTLGGEDDLKGFSVRVPEDLSAELIASSLISVGAGRLDGDEAAINVSWLRQNTEARSQQWQTDFERMLAYAASKGWMDAAGTVVIAHIEKVDGSPHARG